MDTIKKQELIQKKLGVTFGVKSNEHMLIKDVDLPGRTVTGFYNMCFYFDSDYDVSLPGCNNKSIAERGPDSSTPGKIKHLKDHSWANIPGTIRVLEERTWNYKGRSIPGTYFETKMANSTLGNDTLINYQEGIYDNHSFGFRYMDLRMVEEGSEDWTKVLNQLINPEEAEAAGIMFLVKEYKMYEGSTVGLGANRLTPFLGIKSENKAALLLKINERFELLTKQLKSGTQSDEAMYAMQMESLQLNQYVQELFHNNEPSLKDLLIQERAQKDIPVVEKKEVSCPGCNYPFDYNKQPESGMGYVTCPACGDAVMSGGKAYDWSKTIAETKFF